MTMMRENFPSLPSTPLRIQSQDALSCLSCLLLPSSLPSSWVILGVEGGAIFVSLFSFLFTPRSMKHQLPADLKSLRGSTSPGVIFSFSLSLSFLPPSYFPPSEFCFSYVFSYLLLLLLYFLSQTVFHTWKERWSLSPSGFLSRNWQWLLFFLFLPSYLLFFMYLSFLHEIPYRHHSCLPRLSASAPCLGRPKDALSLKERKVSNWDKKMKKKKKSINDKLFNRSIFRPFHSFMLPSVFCSFVITNVVPSSHSMPDSKT